MSADPGTAAPVGVLFVCYANIVRSPLAAAVFSHLAAARGLHGRFRVDSAGVGADLGHPPHPGSVAVAAAHGIALRGTSRPLRRHDLYDFDEILVIDRLVASEIRRLTAGSAFGPIEAPSRPHVAAPRMARIRLLLAVADPHAHGADLDVPDPVQSGPDAFLATYQHIHRACTALLDELTARPGA